MSAMPNPLQELAEKVYEYLAVNPIDYPGLPELLTASVGTLLQAERAATLSQLAAFFDHRSTEFRRKEEAFGGTNSIVRANECESTARYLRNLATPEAASALAAVVQRETRTTRRELTDAHAEELMAIEQDQSDLKAALKHVCIGDGTFVWHTEGCKRCDEVREFLK